MPEDILTAEDDRDSTIDSLANEHQERHTMLMENLEAMLVAARPRLLRVARRQGVAPDAADDVVQETLIEAWRHLNQVRAPDRFEAWLDGICRNVCLRWWRAYGAKENRQINLSHLYHSQEQESGNEIAEFDILDPSAPDPVEELNRHDLESLLDRALGYLPENARELLELCYLAELPQREVALQLGMTISALEARLHRTRHQLQQVLSGQLRAEAEAFGLTIDQELAKGWRETREWCWYCGRHRLRGMFEILSEGHISLWMRCPECGDIVGSGGYPLMNGLRSFRPALKRLWQSIHETSLGLANGWQACPHCGTPRHIRIVSSDEFQAAYPSLKTAPYSMVMECPTCETLVVTDIAGCLWLHPAVQNFIAQHPRFTTEPEKMVEYAGQSAIRLRLVDITSASQLTLLADFQTLRVLATFQH